MQFCTGLFSPCLPLLPAVIWMFRRKDAAVFWIPVAQTAADTPALWMRPIDKERQEGRWNSNEQEYQNFIPAHGHPLLLRRAYH